MHCAEAPKDRIIYHDSYGCSPVEFCKRAKLIGGGRKTVLAHMVNLDLDTDLALLRETGATVSHNPASNCKLASGIAAVPQMLEAGVRVALGTDGAPCNNTYDMLQEMRLAGLLHSGAHRKAGILPAEQLLAMATIRGAEALGLEQDIGSLEVGKKADLVILDVSTLGCAPFDPAQVLDGGFDPVTAVVYSCTGANVECVVVDGRVLVDKGVLLGASEEDIIADARAAIRRIRARAGFCTAASRNYK
jgi:cytosine/adenosine deaminase-related metal-dependent hydrolase